MELLPYNNENLLINFPPLLRRNFEEIFSYGTLGLLPLTLNDISFTKQYTDNNSTYCYYYTLKIPYAGKKLSWELIFNPEDMYFAPDFNFNDESFSMSEDLDLVQEYIPGLVNWNVNDEKSLINVLKGFVALYKKQQIEKLHKENIYSQLSVQYCLLTEVVSPDDVEVYLDNTSAHFVIYITVDTSSLPEYSQPKKDDRCFVLLNPGEDGCILKISYLKLDGSRVNASLQLSPRLEQALGNAKSLHIPIYNKQTLSDYVIHVTKMLQDEINRVEQHHKLKKQYMNYLCTIFGEHMIEFDSEEFSRATIMCEVDDYYCLVHIEIGNNFPREKPKITLHSLYCISSKKPCLQVVEDCPYNSRWSPDVMVTRLITYLAEAALPRFKNHKH